MDGEVFFSLHLTCCLGFLPTAPYLSWESREARVETHGRSELMEEREENGDWRKKREEELFPEI